MAVKLYSAEFLLFHEKPLGKSFRSPQLVVEERHMKLPYGNANFESLRTEGYFYTYWMETLSNLLSPEKES